ncbi:hypothetical protein ACIGXG_31920 [Streptomyces goshikiensis]|uniref:hypothetical protein n=1 Tax=Streptomyces goshikiensis TaxID=1942 RepID=UPI0037D73D23
MEFLLDLPGQWACGLGLAKKTAPLLVEACARTGWELGSALAAELTKNPDGLKQPWRAIPKRIEEDLKRRTAAPVQVEPDGQRCPHHPSRSLAQCPCQRAGNESASADTADRDSGGDDSVAGENVKDVRAALTVLSQGARGSRSRNGRAQGLKKMQQQRVVEESADRARYLDELAGLMQHEQTGV